MWASLGDSGYLGRGVCGEEMKPGELSPPMTELSPCLSGEIPWSKGDCISLNQGSLGDREAHSVLCLW